ncbi:MAG: hypothetical protein VYB37_00265 [Pseudomonadota bacterium]|nr:hypothetical protein [Pseudomonadota bacterium]
MEAVTESKSNLSLIISLPDAAKDTRDPECSITALCAIVRSRWRYPIAKIHILSTFGKDTF